MLKFIRGRYSPNFVARLYDIVFREIVKSEKEKPLLLTENRKGHMEKISICNEHVTDTYIIAKLF